jgi:hypothetical protein
MSLEDALDDGTSDAASATAAADDSTNVMRFMMLLT